MNNRIDIIPPQSYLLRDEKDTGIEREMKDAGLYVNTLDLSAAGDILFVPVRGLYSHARRSMKLVGVFINNGARPVFGLKATLRMKLRNTETELGAVHLVFPHEFTGEIGPHTGLLVHITVPVQGLSANRRFSSSFFDSELSDIEALTEKPKPPVSGGK
ncbi:MAG: hypothetical protein LBO81_07155 [Clostridiales Family XIII bacterium]|jgi:hypothetical protein|nr:hypothetical protein [Clostridiales Family XIII bacterium]